MDAHGPCKLISIWGFDIIFAFLFRAEFMQSIQAGNGNGKEQGRWQLGDGLKGRSQAVRSRELWLT